MTPQCFSMLTKRSNTKSTHLFFTDAFKNNVLHKTIDATIIKIEQNLRNKHIYIVPWGGGGGSLIFSSYVDSGPASTIHPKKYPEFQVHKKKFEILATQKIIPHSVP